MKLNFITVQVRNIHASIHFYEELVGLKVIRRFEIANGEIAFLANEENETKLELIQMPESEKVAVSGLIMNYMVQEALDTIRERAIQLGYQPSEIKHQPPKPTYFRVSDPDGIIVEFSA